MVAVGLLTRMNACSIHAVAEVGIGSRALRDNRLLAAQIVDLGQLGEVSGPDQERPHHLITGLSQMPSKSTSTTSKSRLSILLRDPPQMNVPLFLLAAVRSGEAGRELVNQIPLSPTAASVILTAELATVDYPAYSASLHAAGGKEIWQAQGLHPDSRDTLVLLLPASMLQPGVYLLTVEGAKTGSTWFAVGAYPFRVVRRP